VFSVRQTVKCCSFLYFKATRREDYENFYAARFRVERVVPEDNSLIAELSEIYKSVGWTKKVLVLRTIARRMPTFLLRGENGEPVATAYICFRSTGAWALCGLAVHEAFQCRGYLAKMMSFIHGLAWSVGAVKTCILVGREDKRVYTLYRRLGYRDAAILRHIAYTPRGIAL